MRLELADFSQFPHRALKIGSVGVASPGLKEHQGQCLEGRKCAAVEGREFKGTNTANLILGTEKDRS